MSKPQPRCPSCHTAMDEGFVLDHGHHDSARPAKWIEGEPVQRKWLGMNIGLDVRERETHAITSFRCPRCGLLQDYALES